MVRRQEMTEQRKIMKTTKLILTLAVAFAAAFTSQLKAHEPLLSPRAQANQIRTVPGVTADSLDRAHLFTHKSDAIAHPTTPGVTPDLLQRGLVTGSPRANETFPQLARQISSGTDGMAMCKTMKKGECAMACCKTKTPTCTMPCCKV